MADDPRDPGNLTPEVPHDPPPAEAADTDESDGPDEDGGAQEPAPRQPFLGELVQRRSWPLIAIVFAFGLFLAAVPFLFQAERSPFSDALSLYDRLCAAGSVPSPEDLSTPARALPPDRLASALAAMPCVPRAAYRPRMDPVEGRQYGTHRAFVVTLERRPETGATGPDSLRFMVEEEDGRILWSPWPAVTP